MIEFFFPDEWRNGARRSALAPAGWRDASGPVQIQVARRLPTGNLEERFR